MTLNPGTSVTRAADHIDHCSQAAGSSGKVVLRPHAALRGCCEGGPTGAVDEKAPHGVGKG
jgi:hypothetical protein